jgi:hypothetical protein
VSKADFGDPLQISTYAFCVYDSAGLLMQAAIPSGSMWRQSRTGFSYRDRAAEYGGVAKVALTATTHRAVLRVRAQGLAAKLARPLTPAEPLTVQLINAPASAHCWQSDRDSQVKPREKIN